MNKYNFKIENLHVGQTISNYQELCKLLEIEPKKANSKTAQLKKIESLVKLDRQGNSFTVEEIYNEPLEIIDGRLYSKKAASYINDLELLLLDFLLCCKGDVTISKSGLYSSLKMVNTNYNKYHGYLRPALANNMNISFDMIDEFYDNTSSILGNAIQTVLNRLERKKLIYVQKTMIMAYVEAIPLATNELGEIKHSQVVHIDNDIERIEYVPSSLKTVINKKECNTDDIKRILKIQRQVLKEMGLNEETKENTLVAIGLFRKYKKEVDRRLLEKLNIAYTYKAYKLIFNHEDIEEERQYIMDRTIKEIAQHKVNNEIIEHIRNSNNKHYNDAHLEYIDKYGIDEPIEYSNVNKLDKKHWLKLTTNYMDNVDRINNRLIRIQQDNE